MTEIKVQESKGRLHITIPKSIADLKGWKKGTILEFKEYSGNTCIVEKR
jgi:bifunctional DNA-binding transcriptional regulator/antitoxin component of YhaV-PrlF toxin-antitoxin module